MKKALEFVLKYRYIKSVNTLTRVRTAEVKVILLFLCAQEVLHLSLLLEPDPLAISSDLSYVLLYGGELGLATRADLNVTVGTERLAEVGALSRFEDT